MEMDRISMNFTEKKFFFRKICEKWRNWIKNSGKSWNFDEKKIFFFEFFRIFSDFFVKISRFPFIFLGFFEFFFEKNEYEIMENHEIFTKKIFFFLKFLKFYFRIFSSKFHDFYLFFWVFWIFFYRKKNVEFFKKSEKSFQKLTQFQKDARESYRWPIRRSAPVATKRWRHQNQLGHWT